MDKLFPDDLPQLEWRQFEEAGLRAPVSGVIYGEAKPPCCGVPLGGVGTGCLDIDARGVWGFSSIFNPVSGHTTCMYCGKKDFGLELAWRFWENLILVQRHSFDTPKVVRGDTGARVCATDYSQNMMLWTLPAAIEGGNLKSSVRPGGLVDRVIKAARGQEIDA